MLPFLLLPFPILPVLLLPFPLLPVLLLQFPVHHSVWVQPAFEQDDFCYRHILKRKIFYDIDCIRLCSSKECEPTIYY